MSFTSWEDSLYHHGIKGQKWGVRRYQNTDGSLTEEGRRRLYGAIKTTDRTYNNLAGYLRKKGPVTFVGKVVNQVLNKKARKTITALTSKHKIKTEHEKKDRLENVQRIAESKERSKAQAENRDYNHSKARKYAENAAKTLYKTSLVALRKDAMAESVQNGTRRAEAAKNLLGKYADMPINRISTRTVSSLLSAYL